VSQISDPKSSWAILPSLPDPVGFAGMFAGVSGACLLAGEGSRFLDTFPWEGGTKSFSDRVFKLSSITTSWELLEDRLPLRLGHGFALHLRMASS